MIRTLLLALLIPLASVACSPEAPPASPPSDTVTPALEALAEKAKPGVLGVSILDLATGDARGVNADKPLPMQSVFKLPLGIVVLDAADKGRLTLDETIRLTKDDLSVAHSPIVDAFPGKSDYTIEELVRAAVAQSDNTAADVLLKRIGGPEVVTRFFRDRGVETFRLDRYEYELQPQAVGLPAFAGQWIGMKAFVEAQEQVPVETQQAAMRIYLADPRDRVSPRDAARILALLDQGRLLSPQSTRKMMEILKSTVTGAARLKAGVPAGAIVYHKTGSGPNVETVNSASNDVGIVELADGRKLAVAVLLTGSELPARERDAMIAQVARLATSELVRKPAVP